VLVTIDTLRPDHLGCYGYAKGTSPNLDRLAREGILFRSAVSPVPLTLPSHASIMTGSYPALHGVRDHSGFHLPEGSETLAARLRARGLATGAFVGAFVLDSRFGLAQGFDHYFDRFDASRAKAGTPESLERRADAVAREALAWMEARADGRFFAWLHFYDPHAPYAAPEPFRSRHPGRPYDAEVAFADAALGAVTEFLGRKGWYDDALIVVASDHGEDLGDHGEQTHGYFVYDSTMRVPLVIKLPSARQAGKVVAEQVRTIDIMPTVLQAFGASSPKVQGRGLLALAAGGTAAPASRETRPQDDAYGETYYPYYHFGWSPLLSIRTGKYKYVDAPRPELYALDTDPGERTNLAGSQTALANQLRERLRSGYGRMGPPESAPRGPVDAATREKLQSLGYVSYTSRTARIGAGAHLPDPKDKLEVYARMQRALGEIQAQRAADALATLKSVVALDPGATDAHLHMGLIYKRSGDYAQAVEAFRLALRGDDHNAVAAYNLAHSYASWGKLDEAIVGFERALALDPTEARARVGLGIVYQTRGAADRAAREYEAALAIDPFDTTANNNLAAIALGRRDAERALVLLRRSLESQPASAETHNLIGSAHWLRNEPEPALEEFRAAIRLDPALADSHVNLGMLLAALGRTGESLAALEAGVAAAPRSPRLIDALGRAYLAAGKKAEGDQALERARRLAAGSR
jgi:arylsulfatase A-like enzyme/Tfp pilus assembly protein PilF